jgi:ankyrin repeat protein
MAPEISHERNYHTSADIWGLGVLMLFFMVTPTTKGASALSTWADKARVSYASADRTPGTEVKRPDLYDEYDCFRGILSEMLRFEPGRRPSATQVRERCEENITTLPFKPTLFEYRQISQTEPDEQGGDVKVDPKRNDVVPFLRHCLQRDFEEKVEPALHHPRGLALLLDMPPIKDIDEIVDTGLGARRSRWRYQPERTALGYAAHAGNLEIVEILLELRAGVDARDSDEATPLLNAAMSGHEEIVDKLLTAQAKVDAHDDEKRTPLYVAVANASSLPILKMLLKAGAGSSVNDATDEGRTPLHAAVETSEVEMTKLLIENKADPKKKYNNGQTPLHVAATKQCVEIINILMDSKVDIEVEDCNGNTPLHLAAQYGNQDVVKILLKANARVKTQNVNGELAFHLASQSGSLTTVQLMLEERPQFATEIMTTRNKAGRTTLHMAAVEDHEEIVQFLLQRQPELLRMEDLDGWNAMQRAVEEGKVAATRILLSAGLEINKPFGYFADCLQLASYNGNTTMAEYLLTMDATVNSRGGWYGTSLQAAARFGHLETVMLLLEKQADSKVEDGWFGDALCAASQHDHEKVAQLLVEHGANEPDKCDIPIKADVAVIDDTYWLPGYLKTSDYGQKIYRGTDSESEPPRLPSLLDPNNCGSYLTLSNNDRDVVHSAEFDGNQSVRANNPIPPTCGNYYYETTIVNRGETGSVQLKKMLMVREIAIGFAGSSVTFNSLPGLQSGSWGYHGDDGRLYPISSSTGRYGTPYATGDVIGCCISFKKCLIFYTWNGRPMDRAFDHLTFGSGYQPAEDDVYPMIGITSPGGHVHVNFGKDRFVFDIVSQLKRMDAYA